MKPRTLFIPMFLLNSSLMFSQVSVSTDGSAPDNSAILDVKSPDKGLLVPRMTMTDLESILNPATGLLVYCINDNNFFVNRGGPSSPDWTMVNSKWRSAGPHIYYPGQNVGIGTGTPAALLHTLGTGTGKGNVVFVGEFKTDFPGNPPVSGAGTRMMWYPDKAAFRAGDVDDDQWDADSIGGCSNAMGYNVTAKGVASIAMGSYAAALNTVSVAIGHGAISYGIFATAMGESTTASGYASTAMNNHTNAAAYVSTALGQYNVGGGTANSWVSTDPLFEIGNGASWTSLSNALTVLKNGFVGFGTATPESGLHIKADAWPGSFIYLEANTGQDAGMRLYEGTSPKWHLYNSSGYGGLNLTNGSAQTAIFCKQSNANVGIGTTTPDYKLQVGNAGDGTQARSNAWNTFSDARLKTDFEDLTNSLDMVGKINGYYFFWNTGIDQKRQVGFSAQEVQKVIPELVSEGEDGYLSIEYGKMTPLLLEAIKELKAENDQLKAENQRMNVRLEKIEALMWRICANRPPDSTIW